MAFEIISDRLVWSAFVAGKGLVWVASIYLLLFLLGPIVTGKHLYSLHYLNKH